MTGKVSVRPICRTPGPGVCNRALQVSWRIVPWTSANACYRVTMKTTWMTRRWNARYNIPPRPLHQTTQILDQIRLSQYRISRSLVLPLYDSPPEDRSPNGEQASSAAVSLVSVLALRNRLCNIPHMFSRERRPSRRLSIDCACRFL